MKLLLLLLASLIALPLKIVHTKRQHARQVQSVQIVFNTTSDDKDDDTGLEIQFKTSTKNIVASKSGQFGKFDNNSSHSVDLDIQGTYYDTDLSQSTVYLHISPNGRDTWIFDFDINITWTDGTKTSSNLLGLNLNQSHTDLEIVVFS
jgi:hypothetical protein